eukprot:TRINITY_DN1168_c0_g1_i1.p1 TRINITY_DN1168_c0_g1~~TRINITY_DN1168_c0_g1_i1.p1  ORF type:complete len:385 (+),score=179.02 TRINITY_DN1168_c0_g1_i1:246-1400(+)
MAIPPVGTLGSYIDHDNGLFTRHRFAVLCFVVMFYNALMMTGRALVPAVKKVWPLRVKHNAKDIATLWAGFCTIAAIYYNKVNHLEPRLPENDVLENRITVAISVMCMCHTLYLFVYNNVFSFLPEDNRPQQAANVVRLTVKLVCATLWLGSGDFMEILQTNPIELKDETYRSAYIVQISLVSMYMWELMVRDLRPVNVLHHNMCLIGASAYAEWASAVEPTRTFATIPVMGALTESVCCLGTMAYRFMPRGPVLKRIMIAETLFIVINFNTLLVCAMVTLYKYSHMASMGWIACQLLLVVFTYPAQMNMARVFWSLTKKAGKPSVAPPAAAKPAVVAAAPIAVRNVSELETAPKSIGELHLRKAVKPEFNIMADTRQTVSCLA